MNIYQCAVAISLCSAISGLTGQEKAQDPQGKPAIPAASQIQGVLSLDQLIGREIEGDGGVGGEKLGRVEDLVLDGSGKILEYVVAPAPAKGATGPTPNKVILACNQVILDAQTRQIRTQLAHADVVAAIKFVPPARTSATKPDKDSKGGGQSGSKEGKSGEVETLKAPAAESSAAPVDRLLASELGNLPVTIRGITSGQAKRAWLHGQTGQMLFLEVASNSGARLVPWSLVKPGEAERGLQVELSTTMDKLVSAPLATEDPSDPIARGRIYAHFGATRPEWDAGVKAAVDASGTGKQGK